MDCTMCTYGARDGLIGGQTKTEPGGVVSTIRAPDRLAFRGRSRLMIQSTPESSSPQHIICFGTAYAVDPDTGGILLPLGGRVHGVQFALVDKEDIYRVGRLSWHPCIPAGRRGHRRIMYVSTRVGYKTIFLHRFVLGITDSDVYVDHENHNGLDNRQENLRTSTHQQNIFNRRANLIGTSKYKGVSWDKSMKKWKMQIARDGKIRRLEYFDDELDAARAYDVYAAQLFSDFAYLNFPDGE